nr:putative copia-type protein [Tanacetum cinerariifolium]
MGNTDELPILNVDPKDWFKKPERPPTPYLEWNECKTVDHKPTQKCLSVLAKAEKSSKTFNDLMSTLIDFSAFVMNRLQISGLTQDILVGPAYKLLEGTCRSYIELECILEECYKALTDQLDWNNLEGDRFLFDLSKPLPFIQSKNHQIIPIDYFFNNDLAYLQGRSTDRIYMTFLSKMKAAKYNLQGIEDMVPNLWSPIKVAYDKHALLEQTLQPQRQGHIAPGRCITYVHKTYCNPEENGRSSTWCRELTKEAQHIQAKNTIPKEIMGYYFYFPPENKIVVARYAEFLKKNLISQEASGRAVELKEIQDEDTSPSENTSEIPITTNNFHQSFAAICKNGGVTIPVEVEVFKPPQEEMAPIRRFETNRDDIKSQTGYAFVFNGGAVDWKSSKQICEFSALNTMASSTRFIVLLLGFLLLVSTFNAIPVSRTINLNDEGSLEVSSTTYSESVDGSWDESILSRRMMISTNDYPGSGIVKVIRKIGGQSFNHPVRVISKIGGQSFNHPPDKSDRRSTSGYFTLVGGNLVTWRSKKQKVVALSSAEAEFRGIARGITEVLWVRRLLTEIGYSPQEPTKIFSDNKTAIQISENPVQHDRTK